MYHKTVHAVCPDWYPSDKCKQDDCSELEYCNANMTDSTKYYPQLKARQANEKYITDFLKQVKTKDVFPGYQYLNSLWLWTKGSPFLSDPQEP